MHHIYRTKAFILSSFPKGDSGKLLNVLTPDYGLLKIDAQAVRKNESKLRYAIQNYSLSEIAFVRGKTGDRLTGASLLSNVYFDFRNTELFGIFVSIFNLVERLVVSENDELKIFDEISTALEFASRHRDQILENNLSKAFEVIVVLKILYELGYFDLSGDFENLILNNFSIESLVEVGGNKERIKTLVSKINSSIYESQL